MRWLAGESLADFRSPLGSFIARLGLLAPFLLAAVALALLQNSFFGKALLFTLPSYALIAIAAALAFAALRANGGFGERWCLIATVVFCGYVALRAVTSPAAYLARTDLYCILAAFFLYALTVTVLSKPAYRIGLIIFLLLFAVFHLLVGFVQFGVGENFMSVPFLEKFEAGKRASGFYSNPDHLAGLLEILSIFALSITCWSRRSKLLKVIVGYLALACYVGIAMTGSRGGYLGAVVSLITFAVLSTLSLRAGGDPVYEKYRRSALVITAAVLVFCALGIFESPSVRQRMANIVEPETTRFDLWKAAITQWQLQPVFGTGSGTYRFYGREFRAPRMQADPVMVHNDYLHLLCEYGVLGLGLFAVVLGAHLRSGWKTFARYGLERLAAGALLPLSDRFALTVGALCATAALIVHSLVDFNLHVPANALLMTFVFGILANPGQSGVFEDEEREPMVRLPWRVAGVAAALLLLLQCVRLLPGEFFTERARVSLANEEPELAIQFAHKALAWEQKNPNTYFYLGRALGALAGDQHEKQKRLEYYEAALGAFQQAHQLEPLDGSYPLDMAFAFDELKRFGEAEWMYGVARARDPNSVMMAHLYQTHLQAWQRYGTEAVADGGTVSP